MLKFVVDNRDVLETMIAFLAMIISFIAWNESKKNYKDSQRARLVFHIIQENQKLYLFVTNLGATPAYDINIQMNHKIESPVQSLRVMPPNVTLRYVLMNSDHVAAYSELRVLKITAKYRDIYCGSKNREEISSFPILELLKYTSVWNEKHHCFDISKI